MPAPGCVRQPKEIPRRLPGRHEQYRVKMQKPMRLEEAARAAERNSRTPAVRVKKRTLSRRCLPVVVCRHFHYHNRPCIHSKPRPLATASPRKQNGWLAHSGVPPSNTPAKMPSKWMGDAKQMDGDASKCQAFWKVTPNKTPPTKLGDKGRSNRSSQSRACKAGPRKAGQPKLTPPFVCLLACIHDANNADNAFLTQTNGENSFTM